jgi:hypothetical protein
MAGYALVAPGNVTKPDEIIGNFIVANGEIINDGDPVGWNSSGYVVCASKTQGAIVECFGFAKMVDDLSGGTASYVTGNVSTQPNSPVMIAVARRILIKNMTTTLVPSLAAGKRVWLAASASSGTVSAYTCAAPSTTNGDLISMLGLVLPNGTDIWLEAPTTIGFQYQTAGNSTVNFA